MTNRQLPERAPAFARSERSVNDDRRNIYEATRSRLQITAHIGASVHRTTPERQSHFPVTPPVTLFENWQLSGQQMRN